MPLFAHIAIGGWLAIVAAGATYKLIDHLNRR